MARCPTLAWRCSALHLLFLDAVADVSLGCPAVLIAYKGAIHVVRQARRSWVFLIRLRLVVDDLLRVGSVDVDLWAEGEVQLGVLGCLASSEESLH